MSSGFVRWNVEGPAGKFLASHEPEAEEDARRLNLVHAAAIAAQLRDLLPVLRQAEWGPRDEDFFVLLRKLITDAEAT